MEYVNINKPLVAELSLSLLELGGSQIFCKF